MVGGDTKVFQIIELTVSRQIGGPFQEIIQLLFKLPVFKGNGIDMAAGLQCSVTLRPGFEKKNGW